MICNVKPVMTSKDSKKNNNKNDLEETLITFSDVTEFKEETKSLPDWLKENPRRYSNQSATEVKLGFSPHRILNIDPDKEVKLEYRKKMSLVFCYQNCSDLIVLVIEKNF